ncbi:MAG: hypothetical protein KDA28_11950 [Phycisphaerales bacterium]|nr:hypothetical protein [Phycisphaerales bacterium]
MTTAQSRPAQGDPIGEPVSSVVADSLPLPDVWSPVLEEVLDPPVVAAEVELVVVNVTVVTPGPLVVPRS